MCLCAIHSGFGNIRLENLSLLVSHSVPWARSACSRHKGRAVITSSTPALVGCVCKWRRGISNKEYPLQVRCSLALETNPTRQTPQQTNNDKEDPGDKQGPWGGSSFKWSGQIKTSQWHWNRNQTPRVPGGISSTCVKTEIEPCPIWGPGKKEELWGWGWNTGYQTDPRRRGARLWICPKKLALPGAEWEPWKGMNGGGHLWFL